MPAGAAGPADALALRGIVKRFGDVTALDDVDFTARAGSVHALLGENGAGKSTLMRIASGLLAQDAGSLALFGHVQGTHSVRDAARAGLGMVHQHLSLVANLTVVENVALGGRGLYHEAAIRRTLARVAEDAGLRVAVDALVRELSLVEQQRVEILKALVHGARLLILDEPTAVLAPAESDDLLRWVRAFAARGGTVVLVTHKLREALASADDITVLRNGRVVTTGAARDFGEDDLARAIFGANDAPARAGTAEIAQPASRPVVVSAERLIVRGARGAQRIRDASFAIRAGEIVGIAAIEGSGHRELLDALAGLRPAAAGTLALPPRLAIIPADRGRDALIAEFSLTENVALHGLGRRRGLMRWRAEASRTDALLSRFRIVAPSAAVDARTLSGGNQQRLVVARELEHTVDLVIADNPTRGLDLRASAFVHERLRDAAAAGAAVVLHSSDLDEVLALATRVLVVFQGDVRDVPLSRDAIGRAMVGAA